MKNIFTLALLLSSIAVRAQINLEATFPPTSNSTYFNLVRFGLAGDKFVYWDRNNRMINIYSTNYVLEKTIPIPSFIQSQSYGLYYPTDNLFNNDSAIEFVVTDYLDYGSYSNFYILNEDTSILFERDTVGGYTPDDPYWVSEFAYIMPTVSGTKMILRQKTAGYEIYSLPGILPCYECTNGVYTGNVAASGSGENMNGLSNPFPNPTNDLTRIDYMLPDGIREGELVFYNTSGVEVKKFKVTNAFHFIYVSAKDLPSGTYYFSMQTSSGISGGKKLVVVR